jgi:hypothetical protein
MDSPSISMTEYIIMSRSESALRLCSAYTVGFVGLSARRVFEERGVILPHLPKTDVLYCCPPRTCNETGDFKKAQDNVVVCSFGFALSALRTVVYLDNDAESAVLLEVCLSTTLTHHGTGTHAI